jgi:hypothetical protein
VNPVRPKQHRLQLDSELYEQLRRKIPARWLEMPIPPLQTPNLNAESFRDSQLPGPSANRRPVQLALPAYCCVGFTGHRSSIRRKISSAHLIASLIGLTVAETRVPPSYCASFRAARIAAMIPITRLRAWSILAGTDLN